MNRLLLRLLLFAAVFIVLGELFFRFIVPASTTPFKMFDPQYGILLHDTSGTRDGLYTVGRLAEVRVPFHINRWGWHSSVDYQPHRVERKDVVATFGNSFVAGFQVAEDDHMGAQLVNLLGDNYLFYNFGEGGMPASQFFTIAKYAHDRFAPDIYVFLLLDTDWAFSIQNYLDDPKSPQIQWDGNKFAEIAPTFRKATLGRLTKYSAIMRYLIYNANVNPLAGFHRNRRITDAAPLAAEASPAESYARKYPLVEPAIDYLLGKLKRDVPDRPVIIMSHAMMSNVYARAANCSQPTIGWLERACDKYGFHCLDLGPVFAAEYARAPRSFTFSYDLHWNPEAHRIVAEALKQFMLKDGIIMAP